MIDKINAVLKSFKCPLDRLSIYEVPLTETCMRYEIIGKQRMASFLAQVYHESLLRLDPVENLNYSADRLLVVFGHYFSHQQASEYARNPEKIANRVYANRIGNGNEASGDGWKYRGRGLIQVTGKSNYIACGASLGVDLVNHPDKLREPQEATLSAGWFWNSRKLNELADQGLFEKITSRINGGLNGQEDRVRLYGKAEKVLS